MHKAVIVCPLPVQFFTALWLMEETCGKLTGQEGSRWVVLEVQSCWRLLVLSCAPVLQVVQTDGMDLRVERCWERWEGWNHLPPCPRSDERKAASLSALLLGFQPGLTAALRLAANNGSSTSTWQCFSGVFGSTEAVPALTQQDPTKHHQSLI